uniref:Transmembrane protein n=1 Tax=Craspedostauros australis TaxID=1486917 RepID=A0A7R9WX47_9STRA|mmetsp:Transcript_22903/g.63850  ORF Transcript_22903/g.63850 Transcript_22903/m.63850 type:complete len:277 (+) Transcript_22903:193-1023(+)|eukprot:CAMPEP_0198114752 /NCGR_PEP_ID=MMETSP1442-20131203/6044_1 /TAXON_ID= /ORGANISM="Craspedostauros australis, Strain CCMP3328" /LENGTH=276 /DNA_ID=CAMNT_0043772133 /DNA_START=167 /DNA_END=997 /DNA_ORIENTATION=-
MTTLMVTTTTTRMWMMAMMVAVILGGSSTCTAFSVVTPAARFGKVLPHRQGLTHGCSYECKRNQPRPHSCILHQQSNENVETAPTTIVSPFDIVLTTTQNALSPAQEFLDDITDGWALNYANLFPETSRTTVGQAFLATNLAYSIVGVLILPQNWFLGMLVEFTSVASFVYHYTQLEVFAQDNTVVEDKTVRLALMVDYVFAFGTIFATGIAAFVNSPLPIDAFVLALPMDGVVTSTMGVGFLFSCWIWEAGMPYIVLHSLWHLFSAYAGYVFGTM